MGKRILNRYSIVKLINNNWALDLNTGICYKVTVDKDGNIKSQQYGFRVSIDENGNTRFYKKLSIPLKVLKEAEKQVRENL